jgi:hypothetical protein
MKAKPILLPALVGAVLVGSALPAWGADPTVPECIAASESAIALRKEHKLRAMRTQLLVCAATTCPAEVRTECARKIPEVNAALPSIVFEAKDPGGNDLSAVKVTMDGQVMAAKLDGSSLSLDPGEHAFTFETSGQPAVQKNFVIREAEKERHEKVQFGTPIAPAATAATEGKAAGGTTTIVVADSGNGGQKTAGFIVGGVGIAGLIAGGALLGLAFSQASASKTKNDSTPGCMVGVNCAGDSAWNASQVDQTLAYIVGGVGAAALVTGVVLLVTSGSGKSSGQDAQKPSVTLRFEPDFGPGRAALGLAGTF